MRFEAQTLAHGYNQRPNPIPWRYKGNTNQIYMFNICDPQNITHNTLQGITSNGLNNTTTHSEEINNRKSWKNSFVKELQRKQSATGQPDQIWRHVITFLTYWWHLWNRKRFLRRINGLPCIQRHCQAIGISVRILIDAGVTNNPHKQKCWRIYTQKTSESKNAS